MGLLGVVIALRSIAWFTLLAFVPLWLVSRGDSKAEGNRGALLDVARGCAWNADARPGRRPDRPAADARVVGLIKVALLLQGAPEGRVEVVSTSDEWLALRSRILDAIAPFPEARVALADALDTPEHKDDEQARS
jgi:hypothetical protein